MALPPVAPRARWSKTKPGEETPSATSAVTSGLVAASEVALCAPRFNVGFGRDRFLTRVPAVAILCLQDSSLAPTLLIYYIDLLEVCVDGLCGFEVH